MTLFDTTPVGEPTISYRSDLLSPMPIIAPEDGAVFLPTDADVLFE